MLITLTGKKSAKKQSPLQKRFNRLHQQLEKQKRLNKQFEDELDELTQTYHHHSQEANRKQLDTLIALAKKLITFASRKSLSDWHRDEICEWTADLVVHRISPVDAKTASELQNQYEESIAKVLGMSKEEFHAQLNDTFSKPHEATDSGHSEEVYQDDLFGFDDLPPGDADDWFQEYEAEKHQQAETLNGHDLPAQMMDNDWIKTLFRRAAQNLHPDREPDTEKRQIKQQRLSELLSARKENDVLTMLKIYSEATETHQIELAEKEMNVICNMLEDQLNDLKLQQNTFIHANPERLMVYELLYHKNSKKRQQALKLWQQELAEESEHNRYLLTYLRNLNNLKEILNERRSQRREFFEWMLEDDIF
jgi:hypothetical protein